MTPRMINEVVDAIENYFEFNYGIQRDCFNYLQTLVSKDKIAQKVLARKLKELEGKVDD